jgi:hypothetical protein
MKDKEKSSTSKYFDREYEKAKLELMKSNYSAKYNDGSKEGKAIVSRLIKEQQNKINAERKIREHERKIQEKSIPGRVGSFLKEKQKGEFVPSAIKKLIKKGKLNAVKAIAKGEHGGLVTPGETGYFKKEYNKEAKWLS